LREEGELDDDVAAEENRRHDDNGDASSRVVGVVEFVRSGRCGHVFCRPCIERLLCAPSSVAQQYQQQSGGSVDANDAAHARRQFLRIDDVSDGNDDALVAEFERFSSSSSDPRQLRSGSQASSAVVVPTANICPICRAPLSLFELLTLGGDGGDKNSDGADSIAEDTGCSDKDATKIDAKKTATTIPPHQQTAFAHPKNYDWATACPALVSAAYGTVIASCYTTADDISDNNCVDDGIRHGSFRFEVVEEEEEENGAKEDESTDFEDNQSDGGESQKKRGTVLRPHYLLEKILPHNGSLRSPPCRRIPIQGTHYHAPTRTLLGTIVYKEYEYVVSAAVGGGTTAVMKGDGSMATTTTPTRAKEAPAPVIVSFKRIWDVYLSFSPNYSYVRTGAIQKRNMCTVVGDGNGDIEGKRPTIDGAAAVAAVMRRVFPFDGIWKVTAAGSSSSVAAALIRVAIGTLYLPSRAFRAGEGALSDYADCEMYKVLPDRDESKITILRPTPSGQLVACLFADWDWRAAPSGPEIGAKLEWNPVARPDSIDSDNDDHRVPLTWKRLTESSSTGGQLGVWTSYIGGASGQILRRLDSSSRLQPRPPPTYVLSGLNGNTFCQQFRVGLASYHFESTRPGDIDNANRTNGPAAAAEGCTAYISYEHPDTAHWPPLDNGMPVPDRIYFHDVSFPTPYTFRGTIKWAEDTGTTWGGMAKWEYVMVFDSQYTCIVNGHVLSYTSDDNELPRELSRYGETLVYINAALFDVFLRALSPAQAVETTPSTATDDDAVGVEASVVAAAAAAAVSERPHRVSSEVRSRLQREGASARTLAAIHHVLSAARDNNATTNNPIDFNL